MKQLLFTALLASFIWALPAIGQDSTATPPPPKGKFSGYMFGDYYYNVQQRDTTKKDLNGFQFRRIYFTYDYAISPKFDSRFRLEADQAALSSNGRLIIAEGSGHAIHWEQPTLVVDAVRQVIEDVRSR